MRVRTGIGSLLLLPLFALGPGCESSSSPSPDGGLPSGDGRSVDGRSPSDGRLAADRSHGDTSTPSGCTCGPSEGCLLAVVTRLADESNFPWKVWPTEVDGVGPLIVSATQGTSVLARKVLPSSDLKPTSASFSADLGCLAAGSTDVRAFLDDNANAGANDTSSSDYRDTCLPGLRKVTVTVEAQKKTRAELSLANSCD